VAVPATTGLGVPAASFAALPCSAVLRRQQAHGLARARVLARTRHPLLSVSGPDEPVLALAAALLGLRGRANGSLLGPDRLIRHACEALAEQFDVLWRRGPASTSSDSEGDRDYPDADHRIPPVHEGSLRGGNPSYEESANESCQDLSILSKTSASHQNVEPRNSAGISSGLSGMPE
jgi:hypothetical protein